MFDLFKRLERGITIQRVSTWEEYWEGKNSSLIRESELENNPDVTQ